MEDWIDFRERMNGKKKSVRLFPPERKDSSYRKDIFIIDYVDRLTKKSDPVYDAMKLYNQIRRNQVALNRKIKIKKILG